jgi:hypothetical protein
MLVDKRTEKPRARAVCHRLVCRARHRQNIRDTDLVGSACCRSILTHYGSPPQQRARRMVGGCAPGSERTSSQDRWADARGAVQGQSVVAALAQATQAALRTYEMEKRQALKNAVVHVAVRVVVVSGASTIPQLAIGSDLETHTKYDRYFHGNAFATAPALRASNSRGRRAISAQPRPQRSSYYRSTESRIDQGYPTLCPTGSGFG